MRQGKAVATVLGLILVVAVIVLVYVAFMNSPQKVAQRWSDAIVRQDETAMKKLVLPKDKERVSNLFRFANMLSGISAQVTGIEDQQGQKVAKISIKFSQVKIGNTTVNLSGNLNMPFVLTRDKVILWRFDLEKSEPLIRKEAERAIWEAVRGNPALQQLLQFFRLR